VAGAHDLVTAVGFRRATAAGFLYLLCVVVVGTLRPGYGHDAVSRLFAIRVVIVTALPGIFAVRATAAEVHRVVAARGTRTGAGSLRLLLTALGFAGIALISLPLLAVPLGRCCCRARSPVSS